MKFNIGDVVRLKTFLDDDKNAELSLTDMPPDIHRLIKTGSKLLIESIDEEENFPYNVQELKGGYAGSFCDREIYKRETTNWKEVIENVGNTTNLP